MDLIDVLKKAVDPPRDDDLVDRFNHIYTSIILVLFAVVITTEQYVGTPIKCWTPPQFTESFNAYTQRICWVQNTYRIPFNENIPLTDHFVDKPQILYYQWAPFIFLCFAFLFQLPYLFWRSVSSTSSLSLKTVIQLADKYHNESDSEKKDDQIKLLTQLFSCYFTRRSKYLWGRVFENKIIVFSFIISKLLYLANSILQLILTDLLLSGGKIEFFGFKLTHNFLSHRSHRSSFFPRVGLCDFYIRVMGHERTGHRYTVQCVLPINLYLEAIFLFYWYWLCLVVLLNLRSLLLWMYYTLFPWGRKGYVSKNIRSELRSFMPERNVFERQRLIKNFVNKYLHADGVLVMRLVSHNVSDLVVKEIVSSLYENYKMVEEFNKWSLG